MSRNESFYEQMAALVAHERNEDFRAGWNEAMGEVMLHDKSWTNPGQGLGRAAGISIAPRKTPKPLSLPPKPVEGLTYVAGPMSNVGPPTWNYPAFAEMTSKLRGAGLKVISPAELHDPDPNVPWGHYLRADLAELAKCTRVVFLPNWAKSRGASLEHAVAKALEMELIFPEEFDSWFKGIARAV